VSRPPALAKRRASPPWANPSSWSTAT
jgi:hypothetical protein